MAKSAGYMRSYRARRAANGGAPVGRSEGGFSGDLDRRIPNGIRQRLIEARNKPDFIRSSLGIALSGPQMSQPSSVFLNIGGRDYLLRGGSITDRLIQTGTMRDLRRVVVS